VLHQQENVAAVNHSDTRPTFSGFLIQSIFLRLYDRRGTMKREYQTFVRQFKDLKEGQQELFIKDLTPGPRKYDTRHVLAELASRPEKMPDGDILRIRSESGILHPRPWAIKVLKELPESVASQPWQDVFKAAGRQEE
jgi:hypothetical protein